jgi:hypothetical protein
MTGTTSWPRRVGFQPPVVRLGYPAKDDVVAVGKVVHPLRAGGDLYEELVQARVLHDDVLTTDRPQLLVAGELAGANPRAVDHHRGLPEGLRQAARRSHLDLATGLHEPPRQVLETGGHVDEGNRSPVR